MTTPPPLRLRSRFRRSLGVVALATMLTASFATPASGVAGFGDVAASDYWAKGVQWMADEDITTGTSDTCFSPNDAVTRGQAATFLWRMGGRWDAPNGHPFTDVTVGWQQEPIAWLYQHDVTTGTSATRFSPDASLTRGELAAMLYRLAGSNPVNTGHPFTDVTADWQQIPVAWMHKRGITTGTTPTTFSPDQTVTRGQIATMLYRYRYSPAVSVDSSSPSCNGSAGSPPPTTPPAPNPPPTTTSPPPVSTPFPTESTTGFAGVGLSVSDLDPSGSLIIRTNGAVIDGLDINGVVRVYADNVTIRNSRIRHSSFLGIDVQSGSTGLVVEDVTIIGTANSAGGNIGTSNYTCRRCNLSQATDGAKVGSNVVIEDSLIHNMRKYSGAHNDGVQHSGGGSNILIRHNTILGPYRTSTSAILAQTNVGPINNMVIDSNYLYGGSYTVYLRDKGTGHGSPTNSAVTNNVFAASTSGVFGACYNNFSSHTKCNTKGNTVSLSGGVTFSGNVFDNGTSL